jgi:hypothetical protein
VLKSKQKTRKLKSTTPAYRNAPYKTYAEAVSIQQWFEELRYRQEIRNLAFMALQREAERHDKDLNNALGKSLWLGIGCAVVLVIVTVLALIFASGLS